MDDSQIFDSLEFMSQMVPASFYWMDVKGRLIGLNEMTLKAIGVSDRNEVIGKNVYELFKNNEIGDALQKDVDKVIKTGQMSIREDKIIDVTTGKYKYFSATRAPIRNKQGQIIGIIGTSIEITIEKELQQLLEKKQIFNQLDFITKIVPAAIYWLNLDYIVTGVNDDLLVAIGAKSRDEIVGKTVYDFYPRNIADNLQKDFKTAVHTGKVLEREHLITDITTGKNRYFAATVSPLWNSSQKIIGIIGVSIETTTKKESEWLELENIRLEAENKLTQVLLEKLAAETKAEQLRLENETYLAQKKEQAKFLSFIDKIQRDIQNYKIEALTEQIGIKPKISNSDKQIRLTKRELDVLYYLSLNKSPKDIAQIITIIESKPVSDSTINAIINKKLYPKFEVFNIGQLVEKAIMLNQIPFLLDNSSD